MTKTIIVGGYGPGISSAVAAKFGAEGFSVALAARNAERLAAGVKSLEAKGIKAAAFPTDLADPEAVKALVTKARATLGPITVVQWTAYAGVAGDLVAADTSDLQSIFDVPIVGLMTAVQAALPDLRKEQNAAVLVTNGGLGLYDATMDKVAVQWNAMGLSLANAAKHKLVRMLSVRLKGDGIYVGEVMVAGTVKGTAFDHGNATLEPAAIANKFWEIYQGRSELSVTFG